ncbi:DUF2634 domain-containing protein [Clostridium sp. MD294]|uniref:DUF2634 domain-containing protein n=1 Tax=Clostridium sp. MD294 TaxID=97138 RepID=UPI0002C94FFA|nr:DUF2634 domain-containing protein [Clostridium sp. MD294]NDO45820.1 DUF2634 domain-containing protein [Clostridium sp. MD294]USF30525.1 hypothetical protein C820_001966 [Clostridium sp. MD294]
MFPTVYADLEQLNKKLSQQQNSVKPLGKSCFFDYKTGQHKIIDGKTVLCSSVETMEQWIEKVLRTELNKYGIYNIDETENFGISIYRYIGEKNIPMSYVVSELKREITEQMLNHRYIKEVTDYQVIREKKGLHILFTTVLITEEEIKKEVQLYGV